MGVTFYELAGKGARDQLEELAQTLSEAGTETELLESQTQPGLFLLLCRTEDAPATAAPKNAKVWQFKQLG